MALSVSETEPDTEDETGTDAETQSPSEPVRGWDPGAYVFLAVQPEAPLNPDNKSMLAPTTIFNTAVSFLTNTNLQHYSGEQHLSYFSQMTAILWNMFVSAAVGFCALTPIPSVITTNSLPSAAYRSW